MATKSRGGLWGAQGFVGPELLGAHVPQRLKPDRERTDPARLKTRPDTNSVEKKLRVMPGLAASGNWTKLNWNQSVRCPASSTDYEEY